MNLARIRIESVGVKTTPIGLSPLGRHLSLSVEILLCVVVEACLELVLSWLHH